jgi:hypothetical protein
MLICADGCSRLSRSVYPSTSRLHSSLPHPSLNDNRFCSNACANSYLQRTVRSCIRCGQNAHSAAPPPPANSSNDVEYDKTMYCSLNSAVVSNADRRNVRTIQRLDRFFNVAFMECAKKSNFLILNYCRLLEDSTNLRARPNNAGVDIDYTDHTTKLWYEMLLSHNKCVEPVVVFAGIMAYLVHGQFFAGWPTQPDSDTH